MTVAVVGLGVWLVLNSSAWDFGQLWVQLALALFAAAFLIGAAHQSRGRAGRGTSGRARRRSRGASAARPWGYPLIVLLLVVATWDMVSKPGL